MDHESRVLTVFRFVRIWCVNLFFSAITIFTLFVIPGSWDGRIRLWKLDPSLRSFSPIGSLEAQGLINSLQLTAMPKSWFSDREWSASTNETTNGAKDETTILPHTSPDGGITKAQGDGGVLLVAAVGQEPRLGRWIRLKGDGIMNSALVVALRTRKATR